MSRRSLAIGGLFQDSALQVLDNKVFRVLVILALLPILVTFVVGIEEHSFSILFGLWEIDYPKWIAMLGDDPRGALIEMFLDVVINSLAGSMGITICVAATAFFVPRMLEKGSADLVFTKPLGRSVLYLSRYVTGLFFIAGLGLFLVHQAWQAVDQLASEDSPLAKAMAAEEGDGSGWDRVRDIAVGTLDGLHFVLPKTSDAPLVVLHAQDALFASGRTAVREELLDSIDTRREQERAKRGARRAEEERQRRGGPGNSPKDSYFERHFAFDAPELRYNGWFSVLSSLLFTVLVLALGCWRVRRMDF